MTIYSKKFSTHPSSPWKSSPFASLYNKIIEACKKTFSFAFNFPNSRPHSPLKTENFKKKTSKWHWLMSFHLKNTRKNTILILSCHYKVLMIFQFLRFSLEKKKVFFSVSFAGESRINLALNFVLLFTPFLLKKF